MYNKKALNSVQTWLRDFLLCTITQQLVWNPPTVFSFVPHLHSTHKQNHTYEMIKDEVIPTTGSCSRTTPSSTGAERCGCISHYNVREHGWGVCMATVP